MAMEKQKKLVERLLDKTKQGKLEWRETVDTNRFRLSFSDSGLEIYSKGRQGQFEDDYIISMINAEGSVVDAFSDVDLNQSEVVAPDVSWYSKMMELHSLAKRRALGSDEVLDTILNELD